MQSQGYRVLRFWNMDVIKDLCGVVSAIQNALKEEQ
jgi:very-short-patch-repair endonuclease